jgi:mono/diheme cytochrome c family protein
MSLTYRRSVSLLWAVGFLAIVLATPASARSLIERGKYLTEGIAGCGNCHTPWGGPMKGKYLSGGNSFGGDKAPFKSYAPNITPDMETGIGKWTDAQLITSIREGKRPDGSLIGPPMAIEFYNGMSDNDVKAIVAYLRTVKPIRNSTPKSVYRMKLMAQKPAGKVSDISPKNKVAFGEYLVLVGHCMECHTPLVKGRMVLAKFGAGGRVFPGPWGQSVSTNITPSKDSGIGKWTDAQIKRAITKGVRHDGTKLRPPMCFRCYDQMTEADLDAVVAYLRTIKPIEN